MDDLKRRTWGAACGLAALGLLGLALIALVSRFTLYFADPFSFATVVLLVAAVGGVACAREARRSLS